MTDMEEVDDSIAAVARTLDALSATGVGTPVLIGVLSGLLDARLRLLAPDDQAAVRQNLVEKISKVTST